MERRLRAALQLDDPLLLATRQSPFIFDAGCSSQIELRFSKLEQLDDSHRQWVYQLTERNMRQLYEASEWGWNGKQKARELHSSKSLYLLAFLRDRIEPAGFAHFRFVEDYDREALYCYELQIEDCCRRRGIGRQLARLMEQIAAATKMRLVILTCLNDNRAALEFYMHLGYVKDDSNPESSCYTILSKSVR